MIVICQNDFPIGVLPGATEEQAEAFIKKMRADSNAAITDPHQARPAFHWHDVPEMKEGWYGRSAPVGAAEDMVLDAIERRESSAPVGAEVSYHPCTSVLIEGLKRLEGGSDVLVEWDRARAKADTALAQQPAAVDEVHKAIRKVRNIATGAAAHPAQGPKHADGMRRACNIIEAALAQQPGKRYIDADIALAILREALAQQFIAAAAKDAEAEARAKRLVEALQEARQMIRDLLPDMTFTKWDALLCDQEEGHEHRALAQQPAAVDEAMVDRAFAFCGHDPLTREDVHKMLTAALAQRPAAVVDGWRLVIRYGEYDNEPGVWAEKDGSFVWVAALATQHQEPKP